MRQSAVEFLRSALALLAVIAWMATSCGAAPPAPTATHTLAPDATPASQSIDLLILYTSDAQGVVESIPIGGT